MRILGNEAIQDPTKIEEKVRQQIEQRQQAHLAANEARRLTPEQRREKKKRKLLDDLSKEAWAMVFRVQDLSHPQKRYKVDVNAQQLYLSGCTLQTSDFALVIVEGGLKALRRYKQLMLQRIKWTTIETDQMSGGLEYESNDESSEDEEQPQPSYQQNDNSATSSSSNACVLVWEGIIKKPVFRGFRFKQIDNEKDIRDLLSRFHAEHYYDYAKNYIPPTE
jgi:U4/U6 small nuclear ribonucleoprotein PRP3